MRKDAVYEEVGLETCTANVKLYFVFCMVEIACPFRTAYAFGMNFCYISANLSAHILRVFGSDIRFFEPRLDEN